MNGTFFTSLFIILMCIKAILPHSKMNTSNAIDVKCSLPNGLTLRCIDIQNRRTCYGGVGNEIKRHIVSIDIVDWSGDCLNVSIIQYYYPNLIELKIINSTQLKLLFGTFGTSSRIQKLAMHGLTSLWEVPGSMIADLKYLEELDLRQNVLRHMKEELLMGKKLNRVFLSDNKWDCSDGGLDWLAMLSNNSTDKLKILDYYKLMCHQQLYRGKPLHTVMDIIKSVTQTCPSPCSCEMTHVVSDPSGRIIPLITVDCAYRQLEATPTSLPPNTTTLRLEGNKINTIKTMIHNPHYKRLVDLYLDNNSISSVKELEGSEWFNTFRVLSLRGNLLKQIPVYAFDKAFQSNNNIMHVYLGHNPWRCDCHFSPRFQGLLLKYKRVIRDLTDIRCPKSDHEDTSLVQISTMSLGIVCSSSTAMPISTINIINIVLVLLIFLVLTKFLYDWHSFKTTGKLPWLSSILP